MQHSHRGRLSGSVFPSFLDVHICALPWAPYLWLQSLPFLQQNSSGAAAVLAAQPHALHAGPLPPALLLQQLAVFQALQPASSPLLPYIQARSSTPATSQTA